MTNVYAALGSLCHWFLCCSLPLSLSLAPSFRFSLFASSAASGSRALRSFVTAPLFALSHSICHPPSFHHPSKPVQSNRWRTEGSLLATVLVNDTRHRDSDGAVSAAAAAAAMVVVVVVVRAVGKLLVGFFSVLLSRGARLFVP